MALPAGPSRNLGLRSLRARRFWPTSRSTASAVKVVAEPTKQGFLYVFDRQTGQARLADRRDGPWRKSPCRANGIRPTQPFPTKPPPFELQGIQEKDLIDFTPEIHAEAHEGRGEHQARSAVHAAHRARAKAARSGWRTCQTARTGPAVRSIRKRESCTCSRTR